MAQTITRTTISIAGVVEPVKVAATSVDLLVDNDGYTVIEIDNASVSGITATIEGQETLDLDVSATRVISIAASTVSRTLIGPAVKYNNAAGQAAITLSVTASVNVSATTSVGPWQ